MVEQGTRLRGCRALNRHGQPCGWPPQKGSEWCPQHDPALVESRRERRRKAGLITGSRRKTLLVRAQYRNLEGAFRYRDALQEEFLLGRLSASEVLTLSQLADGKDKLFGQAVLAELQSDIAGLKQQVGELLEVEA